MSSDQSAERRSFSRVLFDAWAELRQGDRLWQAPVVDLSLKGLLVREPADWDANPEEAIHANVRLGDTATIHMVISQRHRQRELLGFSCQQIDLESAGNLRRLVELNLGDADLLERQLGALSESPTPA